MLYEYLNASRAYRAAASCSVGPVMEICTVEVTHRSSKKASVCFASFFIVVKLFYLSLL